MKENFQKKKNSKRKNNEEEVLQMLEKEDIENHQVINKRDIIASIIKQNQALTTRIQTDMNK